MRLASFPDPRLLRNKITVIHLRGFSDIPDIIRSFE